jgi:hypothetical protein
MKRGFAAMVSALVLTVPLVSMTAATSASATPACGTQNRFVASTGPYISSLTNGLAQPVFFTANAQLTNASPCGIIMTGTVTVPAYGQTGACAPEVAEYLGGSTLVGVACYGFVLLAPPPPLTAQIQVIFSGTLVMLPAGSVEQVSCQFLWSSYGGGSCPF